MMIEDKPSAKFLLDLLIARAMGGKNRRLQNRKLMRLRTKDEQRAIERRAARDYHNTLKPALSNRQRVEQARLHSQLDTAVQSARQRWESRAAKVSRFMGAR
jgi:hypothetical protein